MRLRTTSDLADVLAADLAWRRRELTTARFLAMGRRPHEAGAARRSGWCLMYAHWEGFVKSGADSYLEFVSQQRVPLATAADNIVAVWNRGRIVEAGGSKRPSVHVALVAGIRNSSGGPVSFSGALIDTQSNLGSKVLEDICASVGIDYQDTFALKAGFIDANLCRRRHLIAHGSREEIDQSDYDSAHRTVLEMLDEFSTALSNLAALRKFVTGATA